MKTVLILVVSSIFLSNMPDGKEKSASEKIMTHKIVNTDKINMSTSFISRTPIIIVKRD